jgi:hypothetical protein
MASAARSETGARSAREIAEMALAHKVGTAVERAYARSTLFEKRAELMEAWGRYCIGATVTALRASA